MVKKKLFMSLIFMSVTCILSAQNGDSTKNAIHISGTAGITNNGISLIPNFSLGDPAALFNLSVSKGRLSFVTDFNFSLKAKPWYILYWLKYQLADGDKFKMGVGTHLGLNFISSVIEIDNLPKKLLQYERYWVVDFSPRYCVTNNISIGIYYLHSRGLDPGTVGTSNFITINSNFSHIRLFGDMYLGINPQLYYLYQDGIDGFYFTSAFTLARSNFPVQLISMINAPINTDITAGNEFVWNLSLVYSFNH